MSLKKRAEEAIQALRSVRRTQALSSYPAGIPVPVATWPRFRSVRFGGELTRPRDRAGSADGEVLVEPITTPAR